MVARKIDTASEQVALPGLYAAIVRQVDGFKEGVIGVIIPSVFGESETILEARPCFPYGHFFIPNSGDKVWVAFENGDPTAPVWLGVWYPENQTPAAAKDAPETTRVIQTQKGGYQIVFKDDGLEIADTNHSVTIQIHDSGITIQTSSSRLEIGDGICLNPQGLASPVLCKSDAVNIMGNLGAPVAIAKVNNPTVKA